MTLDAEWELDRRRSWNFMFDLMEAEREAHPDWTDDEIYDAACLRNIDRFAALIDQHKEESREQH